MKTNSTQEAVKKLKEQIKAWHRLRDESIEWNYHDEAVLENEEISYITQELERVEREAYEKGYQHAWKKHIKYRKDWGMKRYLASLSEKGGK